MAGGRDEKSAPNIGLVETWMLRLSSREVCFCHPARYEELLVKTGAPEQRCIWKPWSECLL